MSNRLESLNSKKPAGTPKPSLKFKPKVVARKTKEERAKDAPVQVKQESNPAQFVGATRGRGSTRGRGRGGRNNYAGTHLVSSGPLSSGSVSMGNASTSKLGLTADKTYNSISPTPEFLQNLKLKPKKVTARTKSPTPGQEDEEDEIDHEASDSDEDPTKINMTKEYRFVNEETVLFPVRPVRDIEVAETKPVLVKSESPETESTTVSREPTVKSEPPEDKLESIKQHKAKLEQKIAEPTDLFDRAESSKLVSDHKQILDLLTDKFDGLATEDPEETETTGPDIDKYIAFHLPKVLPQYASTSGVKSEPEAPKASHRSNFISDIANLRGQIGHINIHQSGKITINLGNDNNLSVAKGNPSSFLQEVVLLDVQPEKDGEGEEDVEMLDEEGLKVRGKFMRLGAIEDKLVATPIIN